MADLKQKLGYIPDMCPACKQSCTYVIGIDKGSVDIMKAIARFIGEKGINAVHPRKEMEGKYLTSNQVGNLSRPRMHGLIAHMKGERGNYILTKKGASFLKGEAIPRYAIISKAERRQVGYFNPEVLTCRIYDYNESGEPYWEGINYDIEEGRVIKNIQGQLL